MKTALPINLLTDQLNLRLTRRQREGLEAAAPHTPGCASASGVARLAIDNYLAQALKDQSS